MGRDLLSGLHLGCSYLIQLRQALSGSRDAYASASVTDKKIVRLGCVCIDYEPRPVMYQSTGFCDDGANFVN